jgi:catechol 2,3-dioxygenase-like lactoylglutathione lyase family enzyme
MKVGYVVLYVNDAEACRRFWVEQVGMVDPEDRWFAVTSVTP